VRGLWSRFISCPGPTLDPKGGKGAVLTGGKPAAGWRGGPGSAWFQRRVGPHGEIWASQGG